MHNASAFGPTRRRRLRRATAAVLAGLLAVVPVACARAADQPATSATTSGTVPAACPPRADPVGFSDTLNKAVIDGVGVGGLSAVVVDQRSGGYAALVDRSASLPARLWFFTDPISPKITSSTVLRRPDGSPYDGTNFDGEGLAVLPDGDFLVSSEGEPSIRVFGRDGMERGALPVPDRFRVAPAGEATDNATLEGLTVSADGQVVYAAMEGALSGDAPAAGASLRRRILVFQADGHGSYRPLRQIAYEVDPGDRIAEVAAYGDGRLLVLEAAFTPGTGSTVKLYAVTGVDRAADVTAVSNLATAAAGTVVAKQLVVDVARCPTLGATNPAAQANPLLDNFEGLAVEPVDDRRKARLTLVSDDNFSQTQVTRLLALRADLP